MCFFLLFFFFICSEFCHTLKWKGLGFTCLPHFKGDRVSFLSAGGILKWPFPLSVFIDHSVLPMCGRRSDSADCLGRIQDKREDLGPFHLPLTLSLSASFSPSLPLFLPPLSSPLHVSAQKLLSKSVCPCPICLSSISGESQEREYSTFFNTTRDLVL